MVFQYTLEPFDDLLTGLSSFLDWSTSSTPKKYLKTRVNIGVEGVPEKYISKKDLIKGIGRKIKNTKDIILL